MKKKYWLLLVLIGFVSCSKTEEQYTDLPIAVSVDLAKVPYTKLSEYHFFEGDDKNQSPAKDVLPYAPASGLFSNYSQKKQFVWMPKNTKATYNGADKSFNFPNGAVLIKTFYYNNVQPNNTTKIIETRLLIKTSNGWKAYNYIWNEAQTDADLDTSQQGIFIPITWKENGVEKQVDYKIPAQTECITCHKLNLNQTGEVITPIGTKPQNLNTLYPYTTGLENQMEKWKSVGYLGNDVPKNILSTVNWEDTSKSIELRARSYIDINCAHCHQDGAHCDYVAQRFNFSNTNLNTFGVCLVPSNLRNGNFVIESGAADNSAMIIRMSSNFGSVRMPPISRNMIDEEGVQLMKDWINSLQTKCSN